MFRKQSRRIMSLIACTHPIFRIDLGDVESGLIKILGDEPKRYEQAHKGMESRSKNFFSAQGVDLPDSGVKSIILRNASAPILGNFDNVVRYGEFS